MRIGLGSDEIGFECRQRLRATVSGHGHAIEEVSIADSSRSDIHCLVDRLASGIYSGRFERGVLVCASAIGASVLANKQPGVRAALCHDLYLARHGVQDDDMNFLVMGACVVTRDMACELTAAFIETSFIPQERGFGIPKRRLARVVEHIRNNLDKPLAVSALSGMAEMSQSHFSKLFKLSAGLAAPPIRSPRAHQSSEGAASPRERDDCRHCSWRRIRESGALHNGIWKLGGHDAPPVSELV